MHKYAAVTALVIALNIAMLAPAVSSNFCPADGPVGAATARAKAAELIARYDIHADSLKDLEKFKSEEEFRTGDMPPHEFSLLCTLGKFCGVLVLSTPRQHGGRNYEFFGKPQDIEAFRYVRDVVVAQLDRAWTEYLTARPDRRREGVSWKIALPMASRIKSKVSCRPPNCSKRPCGETSCLSLA
jgi:hypothetical protein